MKCPICQTLEVSKNCVCVTCYNNLVASHNKILENHNILEEKHRKVSKLVNMKIIQDKEMKEFIRQEITSQTQKMINQDELNELRDFFQNNKDAIDSLLELTTKKIDEVFDNAIEDVTKECLYSLHKKFDETVNNFLSEKKIAKGMDDFLQNNVTQFFRTKKGQELDNFIREVFDHYTKKYNFLVAKEIIKELGDMSVVQVETLGRCMRNIKKKEAIYLENKEQMLRLE